MTYELAVKLRNALHEACPVDTGQLQLSIQPVVGDTLHWVVVIGNDDGSINGTPSNQYAAFTNFAKTINFKGRSYPNPNYHWVNDAIKKWAHENALLIALQEEKNE